MEGSSEPILEKLPSTLNLAVWRADFLQLWHYFAYLLTGKASRSPVLQPLYILVLCLNPHSLQPNHLFNHSISALQSHSCWLHHTTKSPPKWWWHWQWVWPDTCRPWWPGRTARTTWTPGTSRYCNWTLALQLWAMYYNSPTYYSVNSR